MAFGSVGLQAAIAKPLKPYRARRACSRTLRGIDRGPNGPAPIHIDTASRGGMFKEAVAGIAPLLVCNSALAVIEHNAEVSLEGPPSQSLPSRSVVPGAPLLCFPSVLISRLLAWHPSDQRLDRGDEGLKRLELWCLVCPGGGGFVMTLLGPRLTPPLRIIPFVIGRAA